LEGSSEGVDWVVGGFYQHFEEDSLNEAGLMVVDYFFEPDIPAPFRPFYSDGIDGNNYYFTLPAVDSHAEFDSYAVFGDVTFQVTESVEIFAGLRWSWQDMDLDFLRNDWVGPAGSWNGVTLSPSPFFDNSNPDFVLVDGDALLANPLYAGFQSTTAFTREDRSEDWSGRIGASWDINPDFNVYASASRGFVAAGANVGRVTFRDNAILEPSVSEAYELGFKSTLLEGAMRLNGALFWQETTDLQTTRLIPGQVTTEAFNAGTLTAQGVELDLTWAATNNLRFTGSMTYLDTEMSDLIQPCYPGQTPAQGCTIDNDGNGLPDSQDLDGEDSPNAPELSYRVNARYDLPLREMPFDAYFMVTYTWKDDTQFRFNQDPFTVQEAYGVTDMFIGITDREGRYEMQIFGKNVFDEDYVAGKDSSEPTIGRVFSRIGRFEPYYGMKLTYNF
jgi:iron complex outermembrane receptor protein